MQLQITSIEIYKLCIPLKQPFVISLGTQYDADNILNSQCAVVELKYFSKAFHDNTNVLTKNNTTSPNLSPSTVVIEFVGMKNKSIHSEQIHAYNNLINNEEKIVLAVKKAIYTYYKNNLKSYLHGVAGMASEEEITEWFPEIVTGDELNHRIKLGSVLIYPPKNNICKVDLRFWWSVDDDDVGVIINGDQVVDVGSDMMMLGDSEE